MYITFSSNDQVIYQQFQKNILCVIVVGKTSKELSAKEKLIRGITHRKTKVMGELYTSAGPVSDWFLSGMEAVVKAPSAVHRQPVMFDYAKGAVTASVKDITGEGFALDLGIAKLHFALGVGGGSWAFGNGAGFFRENQNK